MALLSAPDAVSQAFEPLEKRRTGIPLARTGVSANSGRLSVLLSRTLFVLAVLAAGPPATAQVASPEVQLLLQRLRANALVGTERGSVVSRYSFLEGVEPNQAPPELSFSVAAPALYTSNVESLPSHGTPTLEGNPEIRLAWSKTVSAWALSALVDANSVRFVRSKGADGDTAYAQLQVQHIDKDDDTAFAPFVSYTPSLAFDPTFAKRTATTHDLSLGFDKMFNFTKDRVRLNAPDTTAAAWSIGLTGAAARSFADQPTVSSSRSSSGSSGASPSSYALSLTPSLTYNSRDTDAATPGAQWSTSFAVTVSRQLYDRSGDFVRHDWMWSPILTTVLPLGLPFCSAPRPSQESLLMAPPQPCQPLGPPVPLAAKPAQFEGGGLILGPR